MATAPCPRLRPNEPQPEEITLDLFPWLDTARGIAAADCRVLITGETGTGKTWLARALHRGGPRSWERPMEVDLSGLRKEEAERRLFGPTGAIALAFDGTLVIEGLFEMTSSLIARVLALPDQQRHGPRPFPRLLITCPMEAGRPAPVTSLPVGVTHRLPEAVISLRPLRERKEDLPGLFGRFVEEADWRYGGIVQDWDPAVEEALLAHTWPGNLHELRRVAHRAVLDAQSPVLGLPDMLALLPSGAKPEARPTARQVVREYATRVLRDEHGNFSQAARVLGVHRSTLIDWMREVKEACHA